MLTSFFSFFKKGQGLSIETIVILVILLIVLVIVVLIFSGQADNLFSTIGEFIGLANNSVDINEAVR